ncbi:ABC-2 type transport system ATP-binding protein [Nakamurella sp. UYEF19]|uniref:ABC transporter ATP-binding protein n=1 Tax=Nakamurella sp. UYEF19 TaxID=1756392 RepID=UPI00339222F7
MEVAIEVDDLRVERGRRVVLSGLSCSIERGRVTGLLGPSGAGKSTLLRCIVGVQKIRSGSVTVLGREAGSAEIRRRLGYLTQAPSVYADLTVRENARYFAALVGVGPEAADAVIEEVGLAGAAGQLVGTLSGGQRSRASLACALAGRPEVLVLDEPTVGQDPVLREELWDSLRRRADAGTTVMVSSHVMDEANRCDHLLLIRDGSLLADDTPAAIKALAGTQDLDAAFLTLIRRQQEVAA